MGLKERDEVLSGLGVRLDERVVIAGICYSFNVEIGVCCRIVEDIGVTGVNDAIALAVHNEVGLIVEAFD